MKSIIKKTFIFLIASSSFLVIACTAIFIYAHQPVRSNHITISSSSQNTATSRQTSGAEKWLIKHYQEYALPSLSAAVSIDGEVVWASSIGFADLKGQIPATPQTTYRFGSVSKSITSAALVKLDSQNLIDIERPFTDYVDDWKPQGAKFTLADLAGNQSGVRHYKPGLEQLRENLSDTHYSTLREAASIVENESLLFEPGEEFHYSTYGFTLLGLAMERATNRKFESIIQAEVLDPAGMTNTFLDKRNEENKNRAVGYLNVEGYNLTAPHTDLSYKYPGGGYLSTPQDIVRFGSMLIDSERTPEEQLAQLITPRPLNGGRENTENYGLGLNIGNSKFGSYFFHGGMSVGSRSFLVVFPEVKMAIAFVTNRTPGASKIDRLKAAEELGAYFINSIRITKFNDQRIKIGHPLKTENATLKKRANSLAMQRPANISSTLPSINAKRPSYVVVN